MRRRTILSGLTPFSLAGCMRLEETQGAEGNGDESGEEGAETQPSDDVDTSQNTAENGNEGGDIFPPGLSEDGVNQLLADAHRSALANTTAELEWTHSHPRTDDWQVLVEIGSGEAIGEVISEPITIHRAPDSGYWLEEYGDKVTYGRVRQGDWHDFKNISKSRQVRRYILAGEWEPPELLENEDLFSIKAEGTDTTDSLADEYEADSIESFSASGLVDQNGIIRELDAEFRYVTDDRMFSQMMRLQTSDIGGRTVNTPDWVETAKKQVPEVTTNYIQDQKFIELTIEDGNPITPPTDITVYGENGGFPVGDWNPLSETISAGDVLYFYLEDGVIQAARDQLPENVSPEPIEGETAVWASSSSGYMEYFYSEARI